jgi:hypothetical protein
MAPCWNIDGARKDLARCEMALRDDLVQVKIS